MALPTSSGGPTGFAIDGKIITSTFDVTVPESGSNWSLLALGIVGLVSVKLTKGTKSAPPKSNRNGNTDIEVFKNI